MSDRPTPHDARALRLIDRALREGRMSATAVEQIQRELRAAELASTHPLQTGRVETFQQGL
jgi:hypothetical protein